MLGKDSDFFVLPVPYYLVLDTLKLHANPPLVTAYARADVLRLLQLDERHLPLFASLCGNDFVQVKKKNSPTPTPPNKPLTPYPITPYPITPYPVTPTLSPIPYPTQPPHICGEPSCLLRWYSAIPPRYIYICIYIYISENAHTCLQRVSNVSPTCL